MLEFGDFSFSDCPGNSQPYLELEFDRESGGWDGVEGAYGSELLSRKQVLDLFSFLSKWLETTSNV